MKTLFFSTLAILFSTVVNASEPILIQKNGEVRVHATAPRFTGTTLYQRSKIEKTDEYCYLFIQSNTDQHETWIFFSTNDGRTWNKIGRVCSSLAEVSYRVMNNGWSLEVFGNTCEHRYEKKFTMFGEIYEEVQ